MERFHGDQLDELFRFMNENDLEPMSDAEISTVCTALHVPQLPELFTYYLRTAGNYFSPWQGFDFELLDETGCFIDYRDEVREDETLDRRFRKFGFDYKDCLFFLNNNGVQYFFIRLDGETDPLVYSVDNVAIQEEPAKPIPLSKFMIDSYNAIVRIKELYDTPWIDQSERTAVINLIEDNFPFKDVEKYTLKTDRYVRYRIKPNVNEENCLPYLVPVLQEMLTEISSVFVYSEKELYVYVPRDDKRLDNPVGLNIYRDKTAIVDMDYEWGWFTVGDTVYVFGEAFIQKIRDNISAFSLSEYDS
ncbi:MAG: hypothetical protein IKI77_03070 [Oscillospiraceae bacterium]|nr:hypothetical protein [Oscillospiraceae bacterium]